ncbi:restriction endonuclease [Peredibacter sp. HCB2-198]|uniref:restriction endonuclease n=1 Tax=Peredibacter sp. HCB2-198 TaxID=3383025 RepID=UPI0038B49C04
MDFKKLSGDLLNRKLGIRLESFKEVKDQESDLRFASGEGGEFIVQCKHYLKSGFANLKSKIINEELAKITKLNPTRYILVTSVALSPKEKVN